MGSCLLSITKREVCRSLWLLRNKKVRFTELYQRTGRHMEIKKPKVHFIIKDIFDRK